MQNYIIGAIFALCMLKSKAGIRDISKKSKLIFNALFLKVIFSSILIILVIGFKITVNTTTFLIHFGNYMLAFIILVSSLLISLLNK